MKKILVCLVAIVAMLSFVGLTSVHAFPYIEVEGFVNPLTGTKVNNGTTTSFSDVLYYFNVVDDMNGAEMDSISLEFENDVFESFGAVVASMPNDWKYSLANSALSVYQLGDAGTTIAKGEKLMFTVKDVVVYNAALVPGSGLWQEGNSDIWGQSWNAGDDLGGGDGGSTAVVPEPGTLLLLGSGLVGLFYVRRSKAFTS